MWVSGLKAICIQNAYSFLGSGQTLILTFSEFISAQCSENWCVKTKHYSSTRPCELRRLYYAYITFYTFISVLVERGLQEVLPGPVLREGRGGGLQPRQHRGGLLRRVQESREDGEREFKNI